MLIVFIRKGDVRKRRTKGRWSTISDGRPERRAETLGNKHPFSPNDSSTHQPGFREAEPASGGHCGTLNKSGLRLNFLHNC